MFEKITEIIRYVEPGDVYQYNFKVARNDYIFENSRISKIMLQVILRLSYQRINLLNYLIYTTSDSLWTLSQEYEGWYLIHDQW